MENQNLIICLDCLWQGGEDLLNMKTTKLSREQVCPCCDGNNIEELSDYFEEEEEVYLFV